MALRLNNDESWPRGTSSALHTNLDGYLVPANQCKSMVNRVERGREMR